MDDNEHNVFAPPTADLGVKIIRYKFPTWILVVPILLLVLGISELYWDVVFYGLIFAGHNEITLLDTLSIPNVIFHIIAALPDVLGGYLVARYCRSYQYLGLAVIYIAADYYLNNWSFTFDWDMKRLQLAYVAVAFASLYYFLRRERKEMAKANEEA